MLVRLGNASAIEGYRDPTGPDPEAVLYRPLPPGKRVTSVIIPDGTPLDESFRTVMAVVECHFDAGTAPTWVECDSESLVTLLTEHYRSMTGTKVGHREPKGWINSAVAANGTASTMLTLVLMHFAFLRLLATRLYLVTTAGRDWQAGIMGDPASSGVGAYASASWIGLTANATAPASGDTTLAGEITSGNLARAQGTYAHTPGAATYTLTKSYTSDQSITIAKMGLFTASSSGTMFAENLLSPSPAVLEIGDNVSLTNTVTL
jgi:hypothetical protein